MESISAEGTTTDFLRGDAEAAFLGRAAAGLGLHGALLDAFESVLSEALSNAVLHGNLGLASRLREGPEAAARFGQAIEAAESEFWRMARKIRIEARRGGGRLWISVHDEGGGFDPETVAEPVPGAPHGRGLWICRRLGGAVSFADGGRKIEVSLPDPEGG